MDRWLRQLERKAQAEPLYSNQVAYINALMRTSHPAYLMEALHRGTPSRYLRDGSLLIRIGIEHFAVNTDFELFRLDPRITQAMAGFAFETPAGWAVEAYLPAGHDFMWTEHIGGGELLAEPDYQVIGTDYSLPIEDPTLNGLVLYRYDRVAAMPEPEPWQHLLTFDQRQHLVDALVDIAHQFLIPINPDLGALLQLPLGPPILAKLFDLFQDVALYQDAELPPSYLVAALVASNTIVMNDLMDRLNLDYAKYTYSDEKKGSVRASWGLSRQAGQDVHVIVKKTDWRKPAVHLPIPNYFERTSTTGIVATLSVQNHYRNIITGNASFFLDRDIDYDYLTAVCKEYTATIPVDGIGPGDHLSSPRGVSQYYNQRYMPNQPFWESIRRYRYDNDDNPYGFMPGPSFPNSWPINYVLRELSAICENQSFSPEHYAEAVGKIRVVAENALSVLLDPEDYEAGLDTQVVDLMPQRAYEAESYPNNCPSPCYQLEVTTADGNTYWTDAEEILKGLHRQGLVGNMDPRIWLIDVADHIDLSQPQYWLPS